MARIPSDIVRTRENPRITANELARFMIAGNVGQKGIIRKAKEIGTAAAIRYSDARNVLRNAFCDTTNERRIISDGLNNFDQRSSDTSLSEWTRNDALRSIDVLNAYANQRNSFVGYDFTRPPADQTHLQIGGVAVSVNCDVLIRGLVKGRDLRGAGLLRLAKPEEEESESAKAKRKEIGQYAATLVYMHAAQNLLDADTLNHELCWSIDIQASERHVAPRNYRTRAANMEVACEFISAMWDRV